jgi:cytochrome oxidase assembly protein ShyY1
MNPMPDHWSYVLAAYGVAAAVLIGYWRYLAARARALSRPRRGRGRNP